MLFVSEKMAALNVVHRRLVSVGLGRYCLELHSNKAHKRKVIGQLDEALQRVEALDQRVWEKEARRLARLRDELNAYVRALHQRRSTDETVFQAISRLIGLRDVPRVALRWPSPDALDADDLEGLRDLVERLRTAGAACGDVRGHPWAGVGRSEWTPGWAEEVQVAIVRLRDAAQALAERTRACSEHLGLGEGGWSLDELELMRRIALALMETPAPPAALLECPDWDTIAAGIDAWIEHGRARNRLREELRERFRLAIVELDLDDLKARLERAAAAWWLAAWWQRQPVRKALKEVARDRKAPPGQQLAAVLERAIALRDEQRRIDRAAGEARALLGRYWNDGEADWDAVAGLRHRAGALRSLATQAAGDDLDRALALRERWARLAGEGREFLGREGRLGRELVACGEALDAFREVRSRVIELLDLDVDRVWGEDRAPDALGRVRSSTVRWAEAARELRTWCHWRRAREEAIRRNLAALVEAYESGEIDSARLRPVFERSYTQWWLDAITDREPVLSGFFSPEHERKIEQFRAADERYTALTRELIQARLSARVPATGVGELPGSELGVLKREAAKRRRHMSVRRLLERIPNLLPRLKPCLMMSPMSVAQYLDARYPPFDVVVFDEASQIPVWDAVGALARGRQAVIVGDPKQLPPTSFFQRAEDEGDEEGEDVVEDLESILDDCLGAQIPRLHLDWHYRSRHESLITFSNHHYYENRLLTFPSPVREGLGVRLRPVPDGVYDKGKSRTNRAEADAVVDEILRRLRDPRLAEDTIGVVTFSQPQQTLIENLLDAARARDPGLEPYFAEDRDEPIFVKNLENVQGDERDVILFSVCYGPDPFGRVSMNFGALNREGGERRLNVAITRARKEVLVFATLRAEQIDLARTRARGVADLKGFLDYAERGPAAIAQAAHADPEADFDSPFEEAVFDALVKRGWTVHKQVGCAHYRIDLAVVDPQAPGRYLLGVECDGANYHRARTARDRDKLREGVLRDLGWRLHRIWSTDWWTDPDREIGKLEEALIRARESRPEQADEESAKKGPIEEPDREVFASGPGGAVPKPPPVEPQPPALEPYCPAPDCPALGSQAEFYERHAVRAIRERLVEIVRREGPVSLGLAARRVVACFGFARVPARAVERIRELVPRAEVHLQRSGSGEFLWPKGTDPDGYRRFRVPGADGTGARQAADLPLEEIGNAALHLLESHMSAPLDELVRETARLFGFRRVGHVVEERMRRAIELLVKRGAVHREGATITLRR